LEATYAKCKSEWNEVCLALDHRIKNNETRITELEAENAKLREALIDTTASLVASVSLLEHGGKKAAPSDTMFAQMLVDYKNSIDRARAALEAAEAAAWSDDMTKAPKDGTRILVDFGGLGVREVSWTEPVDASFEIWCVDDNKHGPYAFRGYSDEGPKSPRRWRYLPEPPK